MENAGQIKYLPSERNITQTLAGRFGANSIVKYFAGLKMLVITDEPVLCKDPVVRIRYLAHGTQMTAIIKETLGRGGVALRFGIIEERADLESN
jgi:hypothetical protein